MVQPVHISVSRAIPLCGLSPLCEGCVASTSHIPAILLTIFKTTVTDFSCLLIATHFSIPKGWKPESSCRAPGFEPHVINFILPNILSRVSVCTIRYELHLLMSLRGWWLTNDGIYFALKIRFVYEESLIVTLACFKITSFFENFFSLTYLTKADFATTTYEGRSNIITFAYKDHHRCVSTYLSFCSCY